MSLELGFAARVEASRIAEIHMAALGTNVLLRAQFPSPAIREALRTSIQEKALADIDDSKTTVLVVRDLQGHYADGKGEVIAFAKWCHPIYNDEDYVEPPWKYPEGTDHAVLDEWNRKTQEAQKTALGDTPCYCLPYVATDPPHQRRGAGSMLMKWGMNQSIATEAPLYLESTLDSAPFYERHGFTARKVVSMELVKAGCDQPEVYEEITYTFGTSVLLYPAAPRSSVNNSAGRCE